MRVFIIDNDPARRKRLAFELIDAGEFGVVGEEAWTLATPERLASAAPDVILVAVGDPIAPSVRVIEYLHDRFPTRTILAYGPDDSFAALRAVTVAGARALLPAEPKRESVRRALANVGLLERRHEGAGLGHVVTVVGQKGGIGKMTIATNLAVALAGEFHRPVLLVDFDLHYGDAALALDAVPEVTVSQLAAHLESLDREAFKAFLAHHRSGVRVLAAPSRVREWFRTEPDQLARLLDFASTLFDFVIVDTPGAYNDEVIVALGGAEYTLAVTSPDVTSVKNTVILLDLLREHGYPLERIQLVLNAVDRREGLAPVDVAKLAGLDAVWQVPFDAHVPLSLQRGEPLVEARPRSPAARSLRALAARLAQEPARLDRRRKVRGERSPDSAALEERVRRAMRPRTGSGRPN